MISRKKRPSLGIALSGGLALSVCHIGVLKAFEEAGLEISCVAGTSGGAVVGACYAAGVPLEQIAEAASRMRWRQMAGLRRPRLGFFSSESIADLVISQIGEITFDELRVPFRAVAANLLTGEEVEIGHGNVGQAVRASCTIPAVFEPVSREGRLLVDGGLANKLPVDVVRRMGADVVVGSDVTYAARARWNPRNVLDTILITLSFMGEEKTKTHRGMADFMICPEIEGASALSFARWREYVEAGQEAAREVIPAINAMTRRRPLWWRFARARRRRAAVAESKE
jgi:NTE family protein